MPSRRRVERGSPTFRSRRSGSSRHCREMARFKAIEVNATTRQRTGRTFELDADGRQGAVRELLRLLDIGEDAARVDPTRTLVEVGSALWTLVATPQVEKPEPSSLRRGGAKHKSVR